MLNNFVTDEEKFCRNRDMVPRAEAKIKYATTCEQRGSGCWKMSLQMKKKIEEIGVRVLQIDPKKKHLIEHVSNE